MNDSPMAGYTDVFSVAPGETVNAKLSVASDSYRADLVRLLHGDEDPRGPGFVEIEMPASFSGVHRGRVQVARAGSCIRIPDAYELGTSGFELEICVYPTNPTLDHHQTIASRLGADGRGWTLALDLNGHCRLSIGDVTDVVVASQVAVPPRRWTRLRVRYDHASGIASIQLSDPLASANPGSFVRGQVDAAITFTGPLVLAARVDGRGWYRDFFNGKLEGPKLTLQNNQSAVLWDFSGPSAASTVTCSNPALTGVTVNRPYRAVTDHTWDGSCHDPRYARYGYGAIAFHEDDLDDAQWETDIAFSVPDDLESGIYAFRVRAGGAEDHVPFVVRPPRDRATADAALLIPTFSYMAYANDHVLRLQDDAWKFVGHPVEYDYLDFMVQDHPEWGRSLYDTHRDGTGCAQSSRLRPMMNLRPRYRWWASAGAQYLASDLYLVHWLDHIGVRVDVITDEDLHREGIDLLSRYRTLITGTHPEYVTETMLDAVEGFLARDGRVMYMGGNGFYWVTSVPPDTSHVVEVRRGNSGTRAWDSAPGEEHHAFTGERGGLWRHRGRSPNKLVGIGFAAQGWSTPAQGYVRTDRSFESDVSWVFRGVDSEAFGDYGLAMNGAAGDELDRWDLALGSPPETVVLATSRGHGKYYTVVHEDLLVSSADVTGDCHPNVRADLVLLRPQTGGIVWAVGSKSWCASLSWGEYENDVARISGNVLRHFLDSE